MADDLVDMVNAPPHYTRFGDKSPVDVIEAWDLDYCLGNCVKYIARAKYKGDELQDLRKARWYLDRAIRTREERDGHQTDESGGSGNS